MKIKGYAAHFDKPNRNGETVRKKSFDGWLKAYRNAYEAGYRLPVNFDHDPTKIVGSIAEVEVDDTGLHVVANLSDASLKAYNIGWLVEDGTIDAFSTEGYIDASTIKQDGPGRYTANNFFLTAVAIVPNPADKEATFTTNSVKRAFFGADFEDENDNKQNINKLISIL